MPTNQIRIIGGEWRSRQISFHDSPGLRPTPNRVRETLFNWLQYDIAGSCCLDLYAGSGALGFEAASRGAATVVQVENNPQACQDLKVAADKFNAHIIQLVQSDVLRFLTQANPEPFNIVFLDPPFGLNLTSQTCHLLQDKGWLSHDAKIYVEFESKAKLIDAPTNWQLLKSKTAGDVSYQLFLAQ